MIDLHAEWEMPYDWTINTLHSLDYAFGHVKRIIKEHFGYQEELGAALSQSSYYTQ